MAGKMANAGKTAGSSVVEVEGDIDIDRSQVSRSVYVTGYKPTTKSEDLIIHFQRTRNGGGDIDSIVISKRGVAVITFDDPEGKMIISNQCLSTYLEDSNITRTVMKGVCFITA